MSHRPDLESASASELPPAAFETPAAYQARLTPAQAAAYTRELDAIQARRGGPEYARALRWLQARAALAQHEALATPAGFTLRDEANVLAAYAFRTGYLETLHAGPAGITDPEMRKLMLEASARLAVLLDLKHGDPALYADFLGVHRRFWTERWEREALTADLPPMGEGACARCAATLRPVWSFCPTCGNALPGVHHGQPI